MSEERKVIVKRSDYPHYKLGLVVSKPDGNWIVSVNWNKDNEPDTWVVMHFEFERMLCSKTRLAIKGRAFARPGSDPHIYRHLGSGGGFDSSPVKVESEPAHCTTTLKMHHYRYLDLHAHSSRGFRETCQTMTRA